MCEHLTTRQICLRQITALIAAVFVFCGSSHVAIADPPVAKTQAAAETLNQWSHARAKGGEHSAPPASAVTSPPAGSSMTPRARVYLFRGVLGPFFSRGMDSLTEEIQRAGVAADVYEFTICSQIAAMAIQDYRQDPTPIILIGHSMGGRCILLFAETLQAEGIPVSLVVTIDPVHISPDIPLNVERFINIFLSKDVLGGGDIKPGQGFHGHYASYDLAQHGEVSHITIDKMDAVHQQLVAKIVELATTPPEAEGEIVPLRYVVPQSEEIELWDSGTAVTAHSRDTLQTLASRYHVPLWSLAQMNQAPDMAPLAAGQRVIVPRHLMPLATVSRPASRRH